MTRIKLYFIFSVCLFSKLAFSWNNHTTMTQEVLAQWSKAPAYATHLNQSIKTESLQHFLQTTTTSLPTKLNEIEQLLQKNEPGYQALPKELNYNPSQTTCKNNLTLCFKKALRINLDTPNPIMIFDPTEWYFKHNSLAKKVLQPTEIMLDKANENWSEFYKQFTLLPVDAEVQIKDVIITSVVQPDFGLDIGLYSDSGTDFGKVYGFGSQPLSIQTSFGSQVLFHMSTYQDPAQLLDFLPRLKENYPEYRAILYFELSRFAAETKHPYWSAVFLGWGLHYIQDITQPYHAVLTNGLTQQEIDNAIGEIKKGNPTILQIIIALQINRHMSLENLTEYIISSPEQQQTSYHQTLVDMLANTSNDSDFTNCSVTPGFIRNQINKQMAEISGQYATMLHQTFPARFVDDPLFNVSQFKDYNGLFNQEMNEIQRNQFSQSVANVLLWFGIYTRNCIKQNLIY